MNKFMLLNRVSNNGKVIGSTCLYDVPEHEVDAITYEFSRLNPHIKENIEFWKKYVQEKGYYALAIELSEAENSVEYCPLSKEAYEDLVATAEKEGGGERFTS